MAITLDGSNGITTDIASNESATFNRDTTDGDIIILQKDNATVGSIGALSSRLYIGTSGTGLFFNNDSSAITPYDLTSQSQTDADVDLGVGSVRFKDLYLSGGVYLGGTTSTNYLDDYEEGEWTPTYNASGASPSVTYSTRQGRYRKIGNMVVVSWHLRASAYTAGSGDLQVTGLPFAASSASSMGNFGTINFEQLNFSTGRTMAVGFIADSQDYIFFQEQGDSIDVRTLQSADLTGGIRMIRGTITYFTDS